MPGLNILLIENSQRPRRRRRANRFFSAIISQVIHDERFHHNSIAASYGSHYNETGDSAPVFYIVICTFLSERPYVLYINDCSCRR